MDVLQQEPNSEGDSLSLWVDQSNQLLSQLLLEEKGTAGYLFELAGDHQALMRCIAGRYLMTCGTASDRCSMKRKESHLQLLKLLWQLLQLCRPGP